MRYNRSEIMKAAWAIVRRRMSEGRPLAHLLSCALESAWFDAKMKMSVARASAQRAANAAKRAAQPAQSLWRAIQIAENKSRLRLADHNYISELRAAYWIAVEREGAAA